jgi:hypothetical protein
MPHIEFCCAYNNNRNTINKKYNNKEIELKPKLKIRVWEWNWKNRERV